MAGKEPSLKGVIKAIRDDWEERGYDDRELLRVTKSKVQPTSYPFIRYDVLYYDNLWKKTDTTYEYIDAYLTCTVGIDDEMIDKEGIIHTDGCACEKCEREWNDRKSNL